MRPSFRTRRIRSGCPAAREDQPGGPGQARPTRGHGGEARSRDRAPCSLANRASAARGARARSATTSSGSPGANAARCLARLREAGRRTRCQPPAARSPRNSCDSAMRRAVLSGSRRTWRTLGGRLLADALSRTSNRLVEGDDENAVCSARRRKPHRRENIEDGECGRILPPRRRAHAARGAPRGFLRPGPGLWPARWRGAPGDGERQRRQRSRARRPVAQSGNCPRALVRRHSFGVLRFITHKRPPRPLAPAAMVRAVRG